MRVCVLTFGVCQEWMYKATLQEVASLGVDLWGLIEGRASCFVHVHAAAILALVISPDEYRFPETLGFDKHRLDLLNAEFCYLSVSSSMLVNVAKVLSGVDGGLKVVSLPRTFPEALFPPSRGFNLSVGRR